MYHPHADEMVQMAMGMMGFFIVHPRDPEAAPRRPRLRVPARRLSTSTPAATCRRSTTMLDFNLWTFNSRRLPGHRSSRRAQGRPRARAHRQPQHDEPSDPYARPPLRGDLHRRRLGAPRARAGRRSRSMCPSVRCAPSSSMPTTTGDWAFHCHKSHHTMNAMGHDVKTYIGVDQKDIQAEDPPRGAAATTWRWARTAWPTWARWRCRCPTTRCR